MITLYNINNSLTLGGLGLGGGDPSIPIDAHLSESWGLNGTNGHFLCVFFGQNIKMVE